MGHRILPYMQAAEGPLPEVEGGTRCIAHSRLQVPIFSKCTGEYTKIGTFLFFATIAAKLLISKQNTSLLSLRRLEARRTWETWRRGEGHARRETWRPETRGRT